MQLEDYLEFDTSVDRIRVKGTRIGIDILLDEFNAGSAPEMILHNHYPSLTLEQIYATITYYLHNQAEVDADIQRVKERAEQRYQEHMQQGPSPTAQKIRALRAKKATGASPP
jgi:uncharacterized protein (DUF433 family)